MKEEKKVYDKIIEAINGEKYWEVHSALHSAIRQIEVEGQKQINEITLSLQTQ